MCDRATNEEILIFLEKAKTLMSKGNWDFDRPGEVWEFKKNISGTIFYIKIKIVVESNREILKYIGFHDDEF